MGVTGGLQPSRQKVKGMRIKMTQQNNYRRLLKNESLDEITCCSLQLRKSKAGQAVEGIYIILSNIWKGTACLPSSGCFKLWLSEAGTLQFKLLVFRVTPFRINQNNNQNCSIDKSRIGEKKERNYANTLAKIQATANFLMEDMRRNFLPKFIEICMETPCWYPSSSAPTWRPPETVRNICH